MLLNLRDLPSVLTELARLAASVVTTTPTSCGITVRYDANLLTVGSSDARAEDLDETQYRTGGGPCLQALDTNRIVEIPDLRTERRWPAYLPHALQAGVRCSISLPLTVGPDTSSTNTSSPETSSARTLGAMNVYGFDEAQLFAEGERHALTIFAAQAAGTLQLARRMVRDNQLLGQLEEALDSRSVIDQALGIIMGRQRCTATAAFDLLRRESQNNQRRIRDIAADLVTTNRSPTRTRTPVQPG